MSKLRSYFSVLRVIAFGNRKLTDMASAIGVKATDLTRTLKTLTDLDLIEREVPVTEKNPEKSKKDSIGLNNQLSQHFSKIGCYWDKSTEIDIVAIEEEEKVILFVECQILESLC